MTKIKRQKKSHTDENQFLNIFFIHLFSGDNKAFSLLYLFTDFLMNTFNPKFTSIKGTRNYLKKYIS